LDPGVGGAKRRSWSCAADVAVLGGAEVADVDGVVEGGAAAVG